MHNLNFKRRYCDVVVIITVPQAAQRSKRIIVVGQTRQGLPLGQVNWSDRNVNVKIGRKKNVICTLRVYVTFNVEEGHFFSCRLRRYFLIIMHEHLKTEQKTSCIRLLFTVGKNMFFFQCRCIMTWYINKVNLCVVKSTTKKKKTNAELCWILETIKTFKRYKESVAERR